MALSPFGGRPLRQVPVRRPRKDLEAAIQADGVRSSIAPDIRMYGSRVPPNRRSVIPSRV